MSVVAMRFDDDFNDFNETNERNKSSDDAVWAAKHEIWAIYNLSTFALF